MISAVFADFPFCPLRVLRTLKEPFEVFKAGNLWSPDLDSVDRNAATAQLCKLNALFD